MDRVKILLNSNIGRKLLMAATGLLLIGFLVAHMAANLLVMVSAEAYNAYSHALISNPLIYLAELGLIAFFVAHFISGVLVTKTNYDARAVGYRSNERAGDPSRKSLASTTMIISGVVLLIFVPAHVAFMKFGPWYDATYDPAVRDLHRLVLETFTHAGPVIVYTVALSLLGFHAWHGFGSAFESLGITHKPALRFLGQGLALLLTIGFLAVPILVYLNGGAL